MSVVTWQRCDLVIISILQEAYCALFVLVSVADLSIVLSRKIIKLLLVQILHELGCGRDPLGLLVLPRIIKDHRNEDAEEHTQTTALQHLDVPDYNQNESL